MAEVQEMQIDPKTGNSRIQPHFTNPSMGDFNNININVPNLVGDSRKEFKIMSPLPPRQTKCPPPDKSRLSLSLDQAIEHEIKYGRKLIDPKIDMKTLRRTISNRLSAQRSRIKRLEHIDELENRVKFLEVLISGLRPKVEIFKEKKRILEEEKVQLKTAVEIRTTESIDNECMIEEKQRQINILKEALKNDQISPQIQPNPRPYSLEFFQQRLMQMQINQLVTPSPASAAVAVVSEQESMTELNFEQQVHVDQYLEVDEYFNFDDGVVY